MIRVLRSMASLRLTLVGLLLLAVGLVVDQNHWLSGAWAITPPLALLAANLAAAMLVDKRFRRKPALFGFHLCLLLLAALAGYGQLARFDARLFLVEEQEYDAALLTPVRSGPLAPEPLVDGVLRQGAIAVDYTPGLRRGATRSQVWVAEHGWLEVGDDIPVLIGGYRLYTTSNKGYAALLTWLPERGNPQLGAVQFPSYPATELGQISSWRSPGGEEIQMALAVSPSPYSEAWTLSAAMASDATLEVKSAGQRKRLQPGESMSFSGGTLRFERVSMWMGYRVSFDPTLPWLFSLAVLAVVFMSAHFATRLWQPAWSHALSGGRYPA